MKQPGTAMFGSMWVLVGVGSGFRAVGLRIEGCKSEGVGTL